MPSNPFSIRLPPTLAEALGEALRIADSFEDASTALLRALMDACCEVALTLPGTVLRGQVHLRSRKQQALAVLERDEREARWPEPDQGPQHGATAWLWLGRAGGPVGLDVVRREVRALRGPFMEAPEAADQTLGAFSSRDFYLRRQTTHLLALPLHDGRRRLAGTATVELGSAHELGDLMPVLGAWAEAMESLTQLAGPRLASLPVRGLPVRGPNLPVVGARMRGVLSTLRAYAKLDQLVLLRGPTGVGKTHLAEWVHHSSPRRDGPFVVADLLGVPESGHEVALFGVIRGMFTGVDAQAGWVERAAGGTLFIDEIDKLSLEVQSKLLRLLDRREYTVVGEARTRRADLRIIVASNVDLEQAVRAGAFRQDLYFRIDGLTVDVPPLRERLDEIGPWAQFMLNRLHRDEARRAGEEARDLRFSAEAIAELEQREWAGNLRELESVVRRAYALAGGATVKIIGATSGSVAVGTAPSPLCSDDRQRSVQGSEISSLDALTDQVALLIFAQIQRRRGAQLPPWCASKGDLIIVDALRAQLVSLATASTNNSNEAMTLLGMNNRAAKGNAHREVKRAERFKTRRSAPK